MSSSSEDSADEDYVPAGVEESDVSDSSGESEGENVAAASTLATSTKRKKVTRNVRSTRTRKQESSSGESDEEVDEDVSSRADEIWKGFKDDAAALVGKKRVDAPAAAAATASSAVKTSGDTTGTSGDLSSTTSSTAASAAVPSSTSPAAEAKSPSIEKRVGASPAAAAASSSRTGASALLAGGSHGAGSLESRLKPKLGLFTSSVLDSSSDKAVEMQNRLSAGLGASKPGARTGGSAALAALMGKADGKKSGASTLEKCHSDWHSFKSTSGLGEDMTQHNKDGYLEKQDFLKRSELREWEKERTIRTGKPR